MRIQPLKGARRTVVYMLATTQSMRLEALRSVCWFTLMQELYVLTSMIYEVVFEKLEVLLLESLEVRVP